MVIRQTNKKGQMPHSATSAQHDIISLRSIKYYKSSNDARHPATERKQKDYKHRTTTLIDNCQGRKEDCKQHT